MYTLFKDTKNINEARNIINNNMTIFEKNIQNIFNDYNYDMKFNVNYGLNYFPEKEFKNVLYEEGYYESIVVSIGEAKGDNWWCVMYPPLCFVNKNENTNQIKYKSIIVEWFQKLF